MKKIFQLILLMATILFSTSCQDFLEQSSKSDATLGFVFSSPELANSYLTGAYETWRDSRIHSNGLFYELAVCSSDAERHPEKYADQTRHIPENLYYEGTETFNIDFEATPWSNAYNIISVCNTLITNYEASDLYAEFMANGEPTAVSNIYGQAIALRATVYLELTRYYGDIPHQISSLVTDSVLTSRDYIYEYQIEKLKSVVPLMYRVGESDVASAKSMNRTYVEGLIGRYCLYAGGYATRRTDLGADFYKDLDGNTISFEQMGAEYKGAVYNRRTDYKKFYEIAKEYLAACVANPGTASLVTSDPRSKSGAGQNFGNPFQYVFQQMLNLSISSESIYEIAETQGVYSERPYAFGRPSAGGGSNAWPCKSYGQSRFHPTYYYGDFDPNDLRRDATVAVTASTGKGIETILSLVPGSKTNGGLANNKWDENRMNPPYYQAQRKSGVSNPYMRMSDVILMLAEVYAELGEDANAKTELAKVHNRAFANTTLANLDGFITKNGGIKQAIAEERKLEFGGEGIRKYDLIRTGKFPEAIIKLKSGLSAMVNGLKADGYYAFENGNVISNYIWTKSVDAKTELGYRLTTECTDKTNPLLFPGWRGQYDDWESLYLNYGDNFNTNVAIKGLFNYIDPNGTEAANLEADGYLRTRWGADIVGTKIAAEGDIVVTDYSDEYSTFVYRGFVDGSAPIYLVPIPSTTVFTSNGSITNGYGFPQE